MNTLPHRLSQFLLDQPETGDGLHIVALKLKNGHIFEDVAISRCSIIAAVRGHSSVPFDGDDVVDLTVTHRRWGFDHQPTNS